MATLPNIFITYEQLTAEKLKSRHIGQTKSNVLSNQKMKIFWMVVRIVVGMVGLEGFVQSGGEGEGGSRWWWGWSC